MQEIVEIDISLTREMKQPIMGTQGDTMSRFFLVTLLDDNGQPRPLTTDNIVKQIVKRRDGITSFQPCIMEKNATNENVITDPKNAIVKKTLDELDMTLLNEKGQVLIELSNCDLELTDCNLDIQLSIYNVDVKDEYGPPIISTPIFYLRVGKRLYSDNFGVCENESDILDNVEWIRRAIGIATDCLGEGQEPFISIFCALNSIYYYLTNNTQDSLDEILRKVNLIYDFLVNTEDVKLDLIIDLLNNLNDKSDEILENTNEILENIQVSAGIGGEYLITGVYEEIIPLPKNVRTIYITACAQGEDGYSDIHNSDIRLSAGNGGNAGGFGSGGGGAGTAVKQTGTNDIYYIGGHGGSGGGGWCGWGANGEHPNNNESLNHDYIASNGYRGMGSDFVYMKPITLNEGDIVKVTAGSLYDNTAGNGDTVVYVNNKPVLVINRPVTGEADRIGAIVYTDGTAGTDYPEPDRTTKTEKIHNYYTYDSSFTFLGSRSQTETKIFYAGEGGSRGEYIDFENPDIDTSVQRSIVGSWNVEGDQGKGGKGSAGAVILSW